VRVLEIVSGLWVVPLWLVLAALAPRGTTRWVGVFALLVAAPLPAILAARRRVRQTAAAREAALDSAERARQFCETMRFRVQRLTAELSDAGHQARVTHQMSLLGQFVAGFMHEVNTPLAILIGRAEVLLAERQDDETLCRDLREILKEARYVDKIAGTLLPALKQNRSDATFEPALPAETITRALAALEPMARDQDTSLIFVPRDAPRVNLPAHVLEEVVRALVTNALQALAGTPDAQVRVTIAPTPPGRSTVVLEVEDDGPGIPDGIRVDLFKPFVSRGSHERRSGLGLFIVASLLSMYDGTIRHDMGYTGGARFVVEVPRARFTSEQPYHWFVKPLEAGSQEES